MQHKEPQHLETAFHHPDGRIGWYEMTIQPIPEGIFILSVDVTERHRVEQALHEANEGLEIWDKSRYHTYLESLEGKDGELETALQELGI